MTPSSCRSEPNNFKFGLWTVLVQYLALVCGEHWLQHTVGHHEVHGRQVPAQLVRLDGQGLGRGGGQRGGGGRGGGARVEQLTATVDYQLYEMRLSHRPIMNSDQKHIFQEITTISKLFVCDLTQ